MPADTVQGLDVRPRLEVEASFGAPISESARFRRRIATGRFGDRRSEAGASRPLRRQFPNPDVPEPRLVAVIGQHDATLDFFAEARLVLELGPGHGRLDFSAAQFVFDHLDAIEPVLDMFALDEDAGRVPFTRRFDGRFHAERQHVVKRRRLRAWVSDGRVVHHLILWPRRRRAGFRDEIFQAVVRLRRQLPLPPQFKVVEFGLGDDVAAALAGDLLEATVLPSSIGSITILQWVLL